MQWWRADASLVAVSSGDEGGGMAGGECWGQAATCGKGATLLVKRRRPSVPRSMVADANA
eukprot:scaffold8710_cov118-Isochrysis_galbana.AAC.1